MADEPYEPLTDRNLWLNHWIVVFFPTVRAEMVEFGDYETGEKYTPKEAAARAFAELEDQLKDAAREGAAELDELEILVFERGVETGRFEMRLGFEELTRGRTAPEWRGTPTCPDCDYDVKPVPEDAPELAKQRRNARGCAPECPGTAEPVYSRR